MHSHKIEDLEKVELKDSVSRLLRRLFHEHLLTFKEMFHDIKLFDGQQRILFHLLHHEGENQSDIAKSHGIKKATVNKAISSMEEKGLIEKRKDESKKRAFKLYLTDKGIEMKEPIEKKIKEIQEVILEGFSDADQTVLKAFLIKMIHNLSDFRGSNDSDIGKTKIKIKIIKDETD